MLESSHGHINVLIGFHKASPLALLMHYKVVKLWRIALSSHGVLFSTVLAEGRANQCMTRSHGCPRINESFSFARRMFSL
mmetsp:Transcript_5355/g.15630  ORF Transcript_5355/g.15630 Transcript_5355/m.15630 type:complete len:80 (+) Transcript_5355:193-432(+)